MEFGTPPSDTDFPDLPPHDIFPTWYKEFSFELDTDKTMFGYNVEDNPGGNRFLTFGTSSDGCIPR